jgi:crotonobetainyl-CoA:carnitine CoA-transferase CaiB-like acyl-CoA transferase
VALKLLIEAALHSRSAEIWETVLNRAGAPAGRVLTIRQALAEPQVIGRGMTKTFDGIERPLTVLRGGFLVDGTAPMPKAPPPVLGAHGADISRNWKRCDERRRWTQGR